MGGDITRDILFKKILKSVKEIQNHYDYCKNLILIRLNGTIPDEPPISVTSQAQQRNKASNNVQIDLHKTTSVK